MKTKPSKKREQLYETVLTEYERLGEQLASPRWRKLGHAELSAMHIILSVWNEILVRPKKEKRS